METSVLHSVTEDLAGCLSEVAEGDLDRPTTGGAGDVGALYLRLIEQNLQVASAVAVESSAWASRSGSDHRSASRAPAPADVYGGGYEVEYRRTAALMEAAFSSKAAAAPVLLRQRDDERTVAEFYAAVVGDVVLRTIELAQALGLGYEPGSMVAGYLEGR